MSTMPAVSPAHILPAEALLAHWQGHRRLTRRVIDLFPEHDLLHYSVAGMRPFGTMAMELVSIAVPMVQEIVTGGSTPLGHPAPTSKADLLRQWDESTEALDRLWPQIALATFDETRTAFGQYPGKVYDLLLYAIDNEIHHRGQGYVYLRALGIEPPPFWER